MEQKQSRLLVIGAGIILALFVVFNLVSSYFTDLLWFESHDQADVWWTVWWTRIVLFLIGGAVPAIILCANLFIVGRRVRSASMRNPWPSGWIWLLLLGSIVISFLITGNVLRGSWETYVLASRAPDMGVADPIFGEDASFFMFRLGWYQTLLGWVRGVFFLALFQSGILYFASLHGQTADPQRLRQLLLFALPHLAVFIGLIAVSYAGGAYLARYELLFDGSSSKVAGASFVDVNARAPAYAIFSVVGIILAGVIIVSGFFRSWRPPLYALGAWIAIYIVLGGIYPGIVKVLQVDPQEFAAEEQFIEHSIAHTRIGFGLESVDRRKFEVRERIDQEVLRQNKAIIDNIRLWDYRPIRATFRQLQEIRQYYEFVDVDVDRYRVGNEIRQVLLSARELQIEDLPTQSLTWESRHLQYTHGYGLVMAPTNRVTPEGLPELWIKDFPPVVRPGGLPEVKQSGIYFGELTDGYVCVGTNLPEIDYPLEEDFATTTYDGTGGVELGTGLRRLLIAWQFDTWKLLISEYIRPESRLLFRRNIRDALDRLAPFLVYDSDPYLVLGQDGSLYWIQDAYTISGRFPYSARFESELFRQNVPPTRYRSLARYLGANYIRNSVKVVIDAYDGTMHLYAFDERDPALSAWKDFFPGLFRPIQDMPEFLKAHLRYPENLFIVQAAIYTDYHMDNPQALLRSEDRWQIATEVYSGDEQQIEPYYTVIKLPHASEPEYILMLPFIPNNKDNMIAWMAARSDYNFDDSGAPVFTDVSATDRVEPTSVNSGQLFLYDFPRSRQTYGPIQIESRIDQDPDISRDLTLWDQKGSSVIRGNLLVIPMDDSVLYVEPVYLQSTQSPFPELRRVIVADSSRVVMEHDLEAALSALAGSAPRRPANETPSEAAQSERELGVRARSIFGQMQNAAGRGDWAEYGEQMEELEQVLNQF